MIVDTVSNSSPTQSNVDRTVSAPLTSYEEATAPKTTPSTSPSKMSKDQEATSETKQEEVPPPPAYIKKDYANALAMMQGSMGMSGAPVVPDFSRNASASSSSSSSLSSTKGFFASVFSSKCKSKSPESKAQGETGAKDGAR